MLIQRLEITNFRSLKSVDIDCGDIALPDSRALLAVLGRNGGGKSSILYALDVFYDTAARVTKADCYGHEIADIVIRVTYGNLRAEEHREFQPYIENDRLIVTKRIQVAANGCTQKYYAAARQIPQFAALRALGKSERIKQFKALVTAGSLPSLAGTPKSSDQADGMMAEYESTHPELMQTIEREEQFFGPKEVGGGKLDKFTKFVLVPAVRSASVEDQKKGVIYELINLIVLRQVNKRPDVRKLRADMKSRIEEIFSQGNLTELGALGESISKLLEQYAPGSSLRLTWGDPVAPEIQLPQARADLVEDDFPCPITYAGHGLQRGLILTLLQYLAMTDRPVDDDENTAAVAPTELETNAPPSTDVLNPDLILAIEEPELYLHPARCRYLSDLLLTLSVPTSEQDAPRNQIVYATHSPYFVDLHRFDKVRIARKPKVEGYPAPCCVISQYSLHEAAQELARIAGGRPEDFTRDSFRARSLPVMTNAVNEGFFAHAVVVVEGLSDVGVLWRLQSILKQDWAARGIAVVPAIGKENLDRPVVVFRGLKIPTYFVFDGDCRHRGKREEATTIKRNARYQRLAGVVPVDFPDTQVANSWAVFEDEMEAVIKDAVGTSFEEIAQEAIQELRYDSTKDLMKNTEGASRLIELIYEAGHRVPTLEHLISSISALSGLVLIPTTAPTIGNTATVPMATV